MTHDLERRLELLVPVEYLDAQKSLAELMKNQLGDHGCAWERMQVGVIHRAVCSMIKTWLTVRKYQSMLRT